MINNGEKRDLIPIWRPAFQAAKSPEIFALKITNHNEQFKPATPVALTDFLENKSLGTAADLLNVAQLENDTQASIIAAEYIENSDEKLPALLAVSRRVLGLEPMTVEDAVGTEIGVLRNRLSENPENPLSWVDLARAYTIINEKGKSERAMWVALRYSKNHRWILRMATRLFFHFDEITKAHRVLLKNENLRSDPWLLSTELAVARLAGKPLKNWSVAKKVVDSKINPIHLSELSSSIATIEILDGAEKKAKVFFKRSLVSPNSNSLAQVKWADRSYKLGFSNQIHDSLINVSSAYEAKYWESYERGDLASALKHAEEWWHEEAYSASPAQAITNLASLMNNMDLVYETAKMGLKANPSDITLRLNYLFSRICAIGYGDDITQETIVNLTRSLRTIMHGDDKNYSAHAVANIGMLAYRIGQPELGRDYYEQAEKYYEKHRSHARVFLLLNHLRESLISDSIWASDIRNKVELIIKTANNIMVKPANFYLTQIDTLSKVPGDWKSKFSAPFSMNLPNDESRLILSSEYKKDTLESVSARFWLPSDFTTANEALQNLKHPAGGPASRK